jgi:hypothetical protein
MTKIQSKQCSNKEFKSKRLLEALCSNSLSTLTTIELRSAHGIDLLRTLDPKMTRKLHTQMHNKTNKLQTDLIGRFSTFLTKTKTEECRKKNGSPFSFKISYRTEGCFRKQGVVAIIHQMGNRNTTSPQTIRIQCKRPKIRIPTGTSKLALGCTLVIILAINPNVHMATARI